MVARIQAAADNAATNPLTFDDIRQALRTLEQPRPEDWRDLAAAQRKRQVAAIRREIAARAEEFRRIGISNPVMRAEAEIAERWQHASGAALNRWLRRNR
jgi:acyl-CoA reductase-like NAD-dependent aldehyde dehydrogenase